MSVHDIEEMRARRHALDVWSQERLFHERMQRRIEQDRRRRRARLVWIGVGVLVALAVWAVVGTIEARDRQLCAHDPTCHVYSKP